MRLGLQSCLAFGPPHSKHLIIRYGRKEAMQCVWDYNHAWPLGHHRALHIPIYLSQGKLQLKLVLHHENKPASEVD